MSAVVEAFSDAISDVFEAVGDVVEDVVNLAEDVVDFVADNPLLIVAAIAAPYALGAFAAEAGVVGALEVAGAAEAIEVGTAVLEATEVATAVASAEAAAATTVIEAGASVAEASAAASAVAEGASVAEAVTAATGGAVEASAIAEVATASTEVASTSAWESLSQAAQNITSTIGETLAPGADPMIQKFAGQVALNTATNGGDFEKALEGSILGLGTGALGSQIAEVTGSDIAGRVAANATNQLVRTGDVNLSGLASGEVGRLVGSEVADETGSNLLGKAASTVTSSTLQGKDATTGLLNLGINEGVNSAFGATSDLFGAPKAETVKDITGEPTEADTKPEITTPDALDETPAPIGGLAAVTKEPDITVDQINDSESPITSAEIPDDLSKVTNTQEISASNEPVVATKPAINEPQEDILAKIDEITSPEEKKIAQIENVENQLVAPKPSQATEETPLGGLNVIQKTQEAQPQVDPATGEVKPASNIPLAGSGIAAGLLKNTVANTIRQAVVPTKKPAGGLKSAMRPVAPVKKPAAPRVDVSKLMPIAKAPVKQTKPTAPVGKLTPVTNISGLTSLLKKAG
jgi:hypothetical protein